MVQNYLTKFVSTKKLFFALLFLAGLQLSFAATVTIPGTGPTGSSQRKPLGVFFGYERSQMRYTKADLGNPAACFITRRDFCVHYAK